MKLPSMRSLLAVVTASIGSVFTNKPFSAPASAPMHRSGKSSGGKGGVQRVRDKRYKAWQKCFGGLAVPAYQD